MKLLINNNYFSYKFDFLDSGSYIMDGIIALNDHIIFYEILLTVIVIWMLLILFFYKSPFSLKDITHGSVLEIVWTLIPTFILLFIAIPSFALLYAMDEVIDPELTLKVIGHQWYWSYEFSDFNDVLTEDFAFDSYMIPEDELDLGSLRLLETDCRVILPANTHIRVVITAGDVLHCWAVPSLGVKMDAVPGRLNQSSIFIKREGLFFGQCSELCGVNHGFMPIVINAVSLDKFLSWVISTNSK